MRKGLFLKRLTYALALGWTLLAAASACGDENRAPVFDPVASCFVSDPDSSSSELRGGTVEAGTFTTCYVQERQAIEVSVRATDPDGDPISIQVMNAPPTASFKDFGDGSANLLWMPDFIGPWSSAQSPFTLYFVASDGVLSTQLRVVVNVINVNRDPELTLPESLLVTPGKELVFQVRKWDPDLEEVAIEAINMPSGASFNSVSGMFIWNPQPADTGLWPISFRGVDRSGGDCTKQANVRVERNFDFSLSVGVCQSIIGGVVDVPITLVNLEKVAGMELLVKYDPALLVFLEIATYGTRCEDWDYFACRIYETKDSCRQIQMLGIADLPSATQIPPLDPDSGAVVYLRFKVAYDPFLSGMLIPIEFCWADSTDNTLAVPPSELINRERINFNNGGVLLEEGNTVIGDINQNGIAYEVGDAVKLSGYFSLGTSLTIQQLINSDVNQDGRMATLTDLVVLIQRILSLQGVPRKEDPDTENPAVARIRSDAWQTSLQLESDIPVGGAMLVLKGENLTAEKIELSSPADDLELYTSKAGDELKVLILGREGRSLPLDRCLLSIKGGSSEIVEISLADNQGELISVEPVFEKSSLPTRFALYQNYPNPFNPTTTIKYFVGAETPTRVSLNIYNVAGQVVRRLVDEEKTPGEHQVVWDGKNQQGEDVASGVYFYRLIVSDYSENKRMVLLR